MMMKKNNAKSVLRKSTVTGGVKVLQYCDANRQITFWRLQKDDKEFDVSLEEITELTKPHHVLQEGLQKLIDNFDEEHKRHSVMLVQPPFTVIDSDLLTALMCK